MGCGPAAQEISLERRLELLGALPVFDSDDPRLPDVATSFEEASYSAGEEIFAEGDPAHALYVIAEGEARLWTQGRWEPITLAILGPGEMLGERGLVLPGSVRNATLTAHTDLTLLVLPREDFEQVIGASARHKAAFERYADELMAARFVREVGPFGSLDDRQRRRLAARLRRRQVQRGDEIVVQGEAGETCFMIRSGAAEVLVRDDRGEEHRIAVVGPGDLVGEASVLTGEPRNATVRAIEPCELLELAAADLRELATSVPDVAADVTYLFRLRTRPRQAEGIVTSEFEAGDEGAGLVLQNPERGTYFRLSPRGRFIWDRLDGTRTLRELALEYREQFGGLEPHTVAEIVVALARAGMTADEGLAKGRLAPDAAPSPVQRFLRVARRLMFRAYRTENADEWLTSLYRGGGWILGSKPAKLILGAVAIAGVLCFAVSALDGSQALTRDPELLAFAIPAALVGTFVHELAHGLAVKAYGRRVPNAGVGLFWLRPVAFVDTSEMWLAERRDRIMVSLAGPFSGLVLSGILTGSAVLLPESELSTVLWAMAIPILLGVIINMAPFLELDGYHVLCDLLDRPNLRTDSVGWTRRWLSQGRTADVAANRLYVGYTVASLLYMLAVVAGSIVYVRVFLERWLAGLVEEPLAATLAWVVIIPAVVLMLGAILDEYASLWRARRTRGVKPA